MAFFQSGDKEIVVDDDTVEPYESPLAHQKSYDDFSAVQEPKARQGRVYRLQPAVKQYAWGIRGGDSRVARYGLETGALKVIDQSAPYAEIWLGTHPSGPSLLDDGTELSKVVKGGNLPWLLKVLSAGKALSIQAHPDKSLAEKLHKDKPDLYKDSNHKPEMAIALTPFEAMCETRVQAPFNSWSLVVFVCVARRSCPSLGRNQVDLHAGAASGGCRRSPCTSGSTRSSRPALARRRSSPSSRRGLGIRRRRNWLYIKCSSRSWRAAVRGTSSSLQFGVSRRVGAVILAILGRADRSEVVSEFEPKPGPR